MQIKKRTIQHDDGTAHGIHAGTSSEFHTAEISECRKFRTRPSYGTLFDRRTGEVGGNVYVLNARAAENLPSSMQIDANGRTLIIYSYRLSQAYATNRTEQ